MTEHQKPDGTTTQVQPVEADGTPDVFVKGGSGGLDELPAPSAPADGEANPSTVSRIGALLFGFNGATWDRIRTALTTPSSTLTGILNALPWAVFHTTPTTRTDGQGGPFEAMTDGSIRQTEQLAPAAEDNTNGVLAMQQKLLATNAYAPTLYTNFGAATKANIKASAGNVFGLTSYNKNAAGRYLMLHNKATAPAAADAGLYSFWLPIGGAVVIPATFFVGSGGYFATGIGWSVGTTDATFTDAATANEHNINAHYS